MHISEKMGKLSLSLVLCAVIFNAVFLLPELFVVAPAVNDEVLHVASVAGAVSAMRLGRNPLDFWLSGIGLGYPLFNIYQHLAQVSLAVIAWLVPPVPIPWLFNMSRWLLMTLFPLSVFAAMRRLDFNRLESSFAAFFVSFASTAGLMGIEFNSYLWNGTGLFTQLAAMFFLPMAIAEGYRFLHGRGGLFLPVLLACFVLLSHVIYGYMLFLSIGIAIFIVPAPKEILMRLKRFLAIAFGTGIASSYFLIPLWQNRAYIYHSVFEPSFKYDSFGAVGVLSKLFGGEVLDFGRLPVLTGLLLAAIAFLIVKKYYTRGNYCFLLTGLLFWLFLFFGRSFWGAALDLLPGGEFLHFHRFVGIFQMFSLMIVGAGVGAWITSASNRPNSKMLKISLLILAIAVVPIFRERASVYARNAHAKIRNREAILAFAPEFSDIKNEILKLGPGRVFAGLSGSFGNLPYYRIADIPLYALLPQAGLDSFGYAYHAQAMTTDVRLNFNDAEPEQYNLFNIRYVILHNSWTPPRFYALVKKFKNYSLFQVSTTGYFDLVQAPAIFYGDKQYFYPAQLTWLKSAMPKARQYPIIEMEGASAQTSGLPAFPLNRIDQPLLSQFSYDGDPVGKIISERIGYGEYVSNFSLNKEAYLLLKINFFPGWRATLDGNKVNPIMMSPGFIGIKVGPGLHHANFQYRPASGKVFFLVLGILFLAILYMGDRKKYLQKFL